ncbi:MAG: hypothetical protein H6718_21230 [Polyangiaceae bacterium]|nr:hypothetical protein [Myxococcales bacterium]MCB9587942.1 hypothetical protein [Polyangiaceae bacterium]
MVANSRLLIALLACLALSLAGCIGGKTCTLMGCVSGVQLNLAESVSTEGELLITVEADGETFSCTQIDGVANHCPDFELRSNTRLREVIFQNHTPRSLHLRMQSNGTVVVDQDVTNISYQRSYPNGEDCDDGCAYAEVELRQQM